MRRLLLLLLLPFSLVAQNVQNPSFDAPVTFAGSNSSAGSWTNGVIPSWTCGAGTGVWLPTASEFSSLNGTQVAYLNGGSCSQDLGTQPAATYTLTVQQGNRADGSSDPNTVCTASLLSGSTLLVSKSQSVGSIARGAWAPITVSAALSMSGDLAVSLSSSGTQCDFDNVTLASTSMSPPVLDTIKLSTQVLVCASACNGTDDSPETGTLIVTQQKLTQSFGFNGDGTISASFGIDTSVDPADFTVSLSDAQGNLEYKIPQFILSGQTLLGGLSIPPMRIQKTTNGLVFKGFVTP